MIMSASVSSSVSVTIVESASASDKGEEVLEGGIVEFAPELIRLEELTRSSRGLQDTIY